MEIRRLRPEDYEDVFLLWSNTPGMGLNPYDDSREGFERFLLRNPATCFAAVEDDKIVGVILSGHDGRRGYIYHTAVAAPHRGRKIGSRLVDAALDALKAQGIQKAALVAYSSNQSGNAFWKAQGFAVREDLSYRNKQIAPF